MAEIVVRFTDNIVNKPGAYKRGDLVVAYPNGTIIDVWSPNRPDVLVRVPDMDLEEASGYCEPVFFEEELKFVSAYYIVEDRLPPGILDDSSVREFTASLEGFRGLIESRE